MWIECLAERKLCLPEEQWKIRFPAFQFYLPIREIPCKQQLKIISKRLSQSYQAKTTQNWRICKSKAER